MEVLMRAKWSEQTREDEDEGKLISEERRKAGNSLVFSFFFPFLDMSDSNSCFDSDLSKLVDGLNLPLVDIHFFVCPESANTAAALPKTSFLLYRFIC